MIEFKSGDILDATEDYICHQCNCVSRGAAMGLANLIFRKFPEANVYSERVTRVYKRDKPGTVDIRGRIINLFGQIYPGQSYENASIDHLNSSGTDSKKNREQYFISALLSLKDLLPSGSSIAFPYRIGCGLAGGDWNTYYNLLQSFDLSSDFKIVIYQKN